MAAAEVESRGTRSEIKRAIGKHKKFVGREAFFLPHISRISAYLQNARKKMQK